MENTKKKTAVEWLVKRFSMDLIGEIPLHRWDEIRDSVQQAKEMEREQIVNAVDGFPLDKRHLNGEEYYEQTYGGEKE